jgi:MFS transporter, DHA1 family, tetracycline resistance protein
MQKRVLSIIFGTLVLDMIGTGMVFPIIPILFTDPSSPSFVLEGYTQTGQYVIAGLVTALFGLMQFIAAPLLGELSDVYGRKRLLLLGVLVLALSQALFGIGVTASSLVLLLIARTIAGLAGANFSIAQAAIADVTAPQERAKNFGLIGAAFGIGFILGPLLGGWIVSLTGSAAAPFWFAAALGLINVLFVSLMLPETHTTPSDARHRFTLLKGIHNLRAAFSDRDSRLVYLASFLYMAGFTFIPAFSGVLLVVRHGFSAGAVGTFFAIVGAWVVFTQMVILRFITRYYDERTILRTSLAVLSLSIAAYAFLPSGGWMYVIIPFVAIPQGLSMANMQALISKSVSAQRQGIALGINGSLLAFSSGVIPLIAGVGSALVGIQLPFIVGGMLVAAGWFVLFVVARG